MKKIFFNVIFCIAFLGGLFFVSPVQALTVISPIVELGVEPGGTQDGVVKIFNETNETLLLRGHLEEFISGGQGGRPAYIPKDQAGEHLEWFELSQDSLVLKPKQAIVVPFTVNIPENAVPGGYYSVIFWRTESESNQQDEIAVNAQVGTLVLLRVDGDVVEQGSVTEFFINEKQNLFFSLPLNFNTKFENTGNIHLRPQGKIIIKNKFFEKEIPVNSQLGSILPDSTRNFQTVWGEDNLKSEINNFAFGKFSATLDLKYGLEGRLQQSSQIEFWLIPYRLIILIIALILLLIITFRFNKKINILKKYNIKKSEKPF